MSGCPSDFPARISAPCSSKVSRMFVMIRMGFRGLPVALAGQASVHRPHSVHAYPSRSARQESCSTRFTPNVVVFSRSTFFREIGRASCRERVEHWELGDVLEKENGS